MELQNIVKSFICASAVTEFAIVAIDANGKIAVATDATSPAVVGVAQRAASAGDSVEVCVFGLTRMIAGGSLTFVTTPLLAVTTAGAVKSGLTSGDYAVARVMPNINQVSAAANEQIVAFFFGPTTVNA
jgi:hypothetical protein